MSEPITRADMMRLAEVLHDPNEWGEHWRNQMADAIITVCDELAASSPAESASPPRVPVPPFAYHRHVDGADQDKTGPVGAESGPGQPTGDLLPGEPAIEDHVAFLLALADTNVTLSGIVPRLRLAAAEITRFREQVQTERRAGIEAAAQWLDRNARLYTPFSLGDMVRALADAPAPDPVLPLMHAVIDAARRMPRKTPASGGSYTKHVFVIEAGEVWALDHALTRLDAEIAARKGG